MDARCEFDWLFPEGARGAGGTGFLRGLYAAPPNLRAPVHRGMISRSDGTKIEREEEPEE